MPYQNSPLYRRHMKKERGSTSLGSRLASTRWASQHGRCQQPKHTHTYLDVLGLGGLASPEDEVESPKDVLGQVDALRRFRDAAQGHRRYPSQTDKDEERQCGRQERRCLLRHQ